MAGTGYGGQGLPQQSAGTYGQAVQGASDAQQWARDPTKTSLSGANLDPYMNPYTKDVTNATMGEMNRQEAMQNQNIQSQDTLNGSAWGDRSDVRTQANNRDFDVTRAQALADLNSGNFNQAQQGAQFDINNRLKVGMFGQDQLGSLSKQGFDYGQTIQDNQLRSGGIQQKQVQDLIDAAKGQTEGALGTPETGLSMLLKSLQGTYDPKVTKSSTDPGIGGILGGLGSFVPGK